MRPYILAFTLLACTGDDKPTDATETGTEDTATPETGTALATGETGQTSETGESSETGTATGETGGTGGPTLSSLELLGYCDGGTGYYGYDTSFETSVSGDTVTVDVSGMFGGCGCQPESSGVTTTGTTLTIELEHGDCDAIFCCAYLIEVSEVPSGSWTVTVPSVRQVDATSEVVVP